MTVPKTIANNGKVLGYPWCIYNQEPNRNLARSTIFKHWLWQQHGLMLSDLQIVTDASWGQACQRNLPLLKSVLERALLHADKLKRFGEAFANTQAEKQQQHYEQVGRG